MKGALKGFNIFFYQKEFRLFCKVQSLETSFPPFCLLLFLFQQSVRLSSKYCQSNHLILSFGGFSFLGIDITLRSRLFVRSGRKCCIQMTQNILIIFALSKHIYAKVDLTSTNNLIGIVLNAKKPNIQTSWADSNWRHSLIIHIVNILSKE